MRRARTDANVIKRSSEIDGFENITTAEKDLINNQIQELEVYKASHPVKHYIRKPTSNKIPMTVRRKKLKMMKSPSMKVLFTNADQFTHSKKDELQQRILTEKPLVIAVSEVKIKNSKERSAEDYSIDGYTINQTNLLNDTGRGIIIYTHDSLDKSTIQIEVKNKFEEACLLEIRLRGGDVLLFGCIYRSPTSTPESNENNENLNNLIRSISDKSYSHICLVGDFNFKEIRWSHPS